MGRVGQLALVHLAAQLPDHAQGPLEDLGDARLDPLGVRRQLPRHPEAKPLEALARGQRDPALDPDRGRVARVAALDHPQQKRRVADVAGQRPALVERGREGDHPVAGDGSVGGLQADDPAERGGLADRAARVRADRPRRRPPATAAAEPPDDPPGTRSRSQGLSTGP